MIEIKGTLVVIGAGAVGMCTIPLLLREFKIQKLVVLDMKRPATPLPDCAEFHEELFGAETYAEILSRYLRAGDICCNLSILESRDVLLWCMENDVCYLDTSGEEWPENAGHATLDNRTDFSNVSLSGIHRDLFAGLRDLYARHPSRKSWPTCVVYHGMNPGLVNQFCKRGLEDIAKTLLARPTCANRDAIAHALAAREWNALAHALGVQAVHISERDTQRSTRPREPGEFASTWSVDGFVAELRQYSEFAVGTHERRLPREAHVFSGADDVSAILGGKGAHARVLSFVPSGPIQGFLCPHDESITLARFLEVRDASGVLQYRPTVLFAYMPCDASLASIHELCMDGYRDPKPVLLRDDTIVAGRDEVGVLLMGHELGAWWCGSRLDIDRAKGVLRGHNATTMQVAAGVIGALAWMVPNAKEGFRLPEQMPHEVVIAAAEPYMAPFVSQQAEWDPLRNRTPLSMYDYIDRFGPLGNGPDAPSVPKEKDKWQLATMLIQPQGNVWVPSPVFIDSEKK